MQEKINYGSEYCMEFSNDEINTQIIRKFECKEGIKICTKSNFNECSIMSNVKIDTVQLDGKIGDFAIVFYGYQTSIFICNEEIMFIDESKKGTYTSSDLQYNAVYEGTLRNLTHIEILTLFAEVITCFIGAIEVEIIEKEFPCDKHYKEYYYYTPRCYEINVKNNNSERKQKVFENIIINY